MTFIPNTEESAVIGNVMAAITASRSMEVLSLSTGQRSEPAKLILDIVELSCALSTEYSEPNHAPVDLSARRRHRLDREESVPHSEQLLEE
jgi:hypothetical protein